MQATSLHNRLLEWFARWFASAAGVWQTFLLTIAICVAEFIWPNLDPNHFAVLFWLTVYSGVTQPALAYVSSQADGRTEAILGHLEHMCEHGIPLTAGTLEDIKDLA
jgi:hypothetical protein